MADDELGALGVLGAIGLALVAAYGTSSTADASPASTVLSRQIGQHLTMTGVHVRSVTADEGFWIDTDHGRAWVQIATPRESPYVVNAGDVVSFSGEVVAHGPNFARDVGVTASEGAADLSAQGAHITIPVNGLTFQRPEEAGGPSVPVE
jgi:hypothetical protein